MRYLIVLEQAPNNRAAYAPDVWGCVAVGDSPGETVRSMRDALAFHFEGMREDNLPIPCPGAWSAAVRVRPDPAGITTVAEEVVEYPVVLEQESAGWRAYVPDLRGCEAVGFSREEVENLIRDAAAMHVEGWLRNGEPAPQSGMRTSFVDV